jgi:hypothetical protein
MALTKLEKMSRYIPSLYSPDLNPMVRGLLYAWSSEDDLIVESVQNAKEQIFVKFARLQFLDALGSNVGVFRPSTFNILDEQFRQLIPLLSFYPKQVKTTLKKVLDVFFNPNNPRVFVSEINPNEIVIQIPSSVPYLRRILRGSQHFKNYSGVVVDVDNITKAVNVDLDGNTKTLLEDELKFADFNQNHYSYPILSNSEGSAGISIQFAAAFDISAIQSGQRFVISNVVNYPGSFVPDLNRDFTVTKQRGVLNQNILAGNVYPTLQLEDASAIPDAPGKLIFNFGYKTEEEGIEYFGRPNNTTLLLDSSYNFLYDHSIGELVNVIIKPYSKPRVSGYDYSVYLVGVTAARMLAQEICESITASGVKIRWIIKEPEC